MDRPEQEWNDTEIDEQDRHRPGRRDVIMKCGIFVGAAVLLLLFSLPLSYALEKAIAPPDGLELRSAEDQTAEEQTAGDPFTEDQLTDNGEGAVAYTPEEQARLEQRQAEREAALQLAEQKRAEQERAAQEAILEAQAETWSPEGPPSTVEGAFGALYEQIFAPLGDTYECYYNAKGNLYMVLSPGTVLLEGESQERDTIRTLVFDRESKNGECWLIVYYEEILNADGSEYSTAIRNTYAIKKAGGEVIPSGKKAWADVGSAEYQEAAGEK